MQTSHLFFLNEAVIKKTKGKTTSTYYTIDTQRTWNAGLKLKKKKKNTRYFCLTDKHLHFSLYSQNNCMGFVNINALSEEFHPVVSYYIPFPMCSVPTSTNMG